MSVSVTLKSYFYEVLIPSSQKNTSSPIEDILHHVSISFMKKLALYKCFNPRTHTGCDCQVRIFGHPIAGFNPRTHTGCDWLCFPSSGSNQSFNPRTHTGCDSRTSSFLDLLGLVSIHAPTRGATSYHIRKFAFCYVSIHAPTRGATPPPPNPQRTVNGFQSTHPHGVRQQSAK